MWVIVTCENSEACQQTLDTLWEATGNNFVIVNGGSDDYSSVVLPKGWELFRLTEIKGVCEILSNLYKLHSSEEFYGLIPDNCVVQCAEWQQKIKEIVKGKYVVSCDDGNINPFPFTGIRCWPGDLIRKVGFWGIPDIFASGFDEGWIKIAWDVVLFDRVMDVRLSYIPRKQSTMDAEIEKHREQDKETFDYWRRNEYYKIFRKLQFGGEKWHGKTNFVDGEQDGKNQ